MENNKIVEKGIKKLRRENNKIVERRKIKMKRERGKLKIMKNCLNAEVQAMRKYNWLVPCWISNQRDAVAGRRLKCEIKQNWMQGWHSCCPYLAHHASRVLAPFFLGFLSLALFRLQNIKHCCVVSVYFSRFLPFKNFDPRLFSSRPPVHFPLPIFSRASNPFLFPSSLKWHIFTWTKLWSSCRATPPAHHGSPYHSLKNLLIV